MVDKITFMETLRSVQEVAKTSPKPLSKEEIQSYFQDMELSEHQQEMIYQFLQLPQEEQQGNWKPQEKRVHTKKKKTSGTKEGKGESFYSKHFQMYLKEISAVPTLTKEQERTLYKRLLKGEDPVISEISHQWLRRIISLAENKITEQVLLEDLVQEGNMGLLLGLRQFLGKAVENEAMEWEIGSFGEAQQKKLEQMLEEFVKESMESYCLELEGAASSENTILAKVSLIYEARKVLAETNGTLPTLQELCEYTKISKEEIRDILALHDRTAQE